MECNQGQQGFTACGLKLEATTEHSAKFLHAERHLFNVYLTKREEETGEQHTHVANIYPLSFADASKWVRGLITGMAQDIWGFRNVVDCWMEPLELEGVEFRTQEERQRYLIEHVCQQIRKRQDNETQTLKLENEQMRQEISTYYTGRIGGML